MYPTIASQGAALRHYDPKPHTEVEEDGFITVHPQVSPHRGSAPEEFDPRAIRQLIAEVTDLEDEGMVNPDTGIDPHAPLWREAGQKGSSWVTPEPIRRRAITLYGITGTGETNREAATDWIKSACTAVAETEGDI